MGACRYPHRQQGLHCPGHTTPAPLCPRALHKHHWSSTGEVPCRSRESSTTGLATLLTSLCNSLWPSQWARPYEHPRPATGLGLIAGANGRPPGLPPPTVWCGQEQSPLFPTAIVVPRPPSPAGLQLARCTEGLIVWVAVLLMTHRFGTASSHGKRPPESSAAFAPLFICLVSVFPLLF